MALKGNVKTVQRGGKTIGMALVAAQKLRESDTGTGVCVGGALCDFSGGDVCVCVYVCRYVYKYDPAYYL